MKTKQMKFTATVFAMLFTIAAIAQSGNYNQEGRKQGRQGNMSKECRYDNRQDRMANYLELNDQQKEQMQQLRLEHQKKMLPLKNELGEKNAKMQTLSTAENADMKAIDALIDDISSTKAKMMKEKHAHKQNIRKILTEEQRVKFDMHSNKSGNGRGHGKGHRQGSCYR